MQHGNASDYMNGSAKQAVDAALTDAKTQRIGGTITPIPPEGTRPTPAAAAQPRGAS